MLKKCLTVASRSFRLPHSWRQFQIEYLNETCVLELYISICESSVKAFSIEFSAPFSNLIIQCCACQSQLPHTLLMPAKVDPNRVACNGCFAAISRRYCLGYFYNAIRKGTKHPHFGATKTSAPLLRVVMPAQRFLK